MHTLPPITPSTGTCTSTINLKTDSFEYTVDSACRRACCDSVLCARDERSAELTCTMRVLCSPSLPVCDVLTACRMHARATRLLRSACVIASLLWLISSRYRPLLRQRTVAACATVRAKTITLLLIGCGSITGGGGGGWGGGGGGGGMGGEGGGDCSRTPPSLALTP